MTATVLRCEEPLREWVGPGPPFVETSDGRPGRCGSSVAAAMQRQHRLANRSPVPAVALLDRVDVSAPLGQDRVDVEFVHECSSKTPS